MGYTKKLFLFLAVVLPALFFPAMREGPTGARAMQLTSALGASTAREAHLGAVEIKGLISRTTSRLRLLGGDSRRLDRADAERIGRLLMPGDIILTRSDWYVSNVGIPGYWTHSAMYIGGLAGREGYSAADEGAGGSGREGDAIEAVDRGVALSSFGKIAHADALAVLRPNVGKEARERAVLRAITRLGTPYDFDFDFSTDDSLVCSELIYKSYGYSDGRPLLPLKIGRVMGKPFSSPSDLGRLVFSGDAALVAFLDGSEGFGGQAAQRMEGFVTTLSKDGGSTGPLMWLLK